MFSSTERHIAFRYLKIRKRDSAVFTIAMFSLIGIMLGVMTLIVVLSVMRGVQGEMVDSIIGLEGHVTVVSAQGRHLQDYPHFVESIRQMDGVTRATPIVQGQVMLSHRGQAIGAMATGISSEGLKQKALIAEDLSPASLAAFEAGEGILIGSRIAARFGVGIGDSIILVSPEGRATPAGTVPRIQAYPIVGIFEIGMFAYDNGAVFLPFDKAQTFFMMSQAEGPGRISAIEVVGEDADEAGELAQTIVNMGGGALQSYDWKRSNQQLFNAVRVQRNVMFLVVMLIIIVASFNIISSLIMLVRQKRKDIAILRTIGASRAQIRNIFMLVGCLVAFVGTALGVLFGLLIAYNTEEIQASVERLTGQKLLADELYFLSSLPADVSLAEVGMVAGITMLIAFVATLLPARSAAKLEPSIVLRGE